MKPAPESKPEEPKPLSYTKSPAKAEEEQPKQSPFLVAPSGYPVFQNEALAQPAKATAKPEAEAKPSAQQTAPKPL